MHIHCAEIHPVIIPYHKFSSNLLLSPEVCSQLCVAACEHGKSSPAVEPALKWVGKMARKAGCETKADLAILMCIARFCPRSCRDINSNPASPALCIRSFTSKANSAYYRPLLLRNSRRSKAEANCVVVQHFFNWPVCE